MSIPNVAREREALRVASLPRDEFRAYAAGCSLYELTAREDSEPDA